MAKILTKEVQKLVTTLIYQISGFDESSEYFNQIQDFAYSHICSPDYFFNYTKNDILTSVNNLADKFKFQAFPEQGEYLRSLAKSLFDQATNSDQTETLVAIMKLILGISISPTKYFMEDIESFRPKLQIKDTFDWTTYLKNTKVRLKENYAEISDDDSYFSDLSLSDDENNMPLGVNNLFPEGSDVPDKNNDAADVVAKEKIVQTVKKSRINMEEQIKLAKTELIENIQYQWWNNDSVMITPESTSPEANVAIEWNKFMKQVTVGLGDCETNVVPEYKVMRELVWQFFSPHSCLSFEFVNENLLPTEKVTIGSARLNTFHFFMYEFLPYIEMLKSFRKFRTDMVGDYFVAATPDTYRSYADALDEIIIPIYDKIKQIENNIRKQDGITSILSIAHDLRPQFKTLEFLHCVHSEILKNYNVDNGFQNTTFLLSSLYVGLLNSFDVMQQNIYLTLYLKSLYKYFTIIEIWLKVDLLDDRSDEFIIMDKNSYPAFDTNADIFNFVIKPLDSFSQFDGMLEIICSKVLTLAKNIHLLRLLGKLYLITEELGTFKMSLHDEFVHKVLQEIKAHTDYQIPAEIASENPNIAQNSTAIEPKTVTAEESGYFDESVGNFVEMSDGFLATVFETFSLKKSQENVEKHEEKTLYQTINECVRKLFPAKQVIEKTFLDTLNSRYSVPGLIVKNILMNQYQLKVHINLLKHLYLFEDDIIFPFYKKIFSQFSLNQAWGNFYWMTSQLQDLLMDLYPVIYESCRVDVNQSWRQCKNPIDACDLVTLHVRVEWPINLIVKVEQIHMYNEVFQFLLKLKWALNTVHQLQFSVLESKSNPFKLKPVLIQQRIRKLHSMRLFLLNDVTSIHHYIMGYQFSLFLRRFEEELEASYDLESIQKTHNTYIAKIHRLCTKLKDEQNSEIYGFKKLLNLILQLKQMWNNVCTLSDEELDICEIEYKRCHTFFKPIINVEIYDN